MTYYIHLTDPPIYPDSGDSFIGDTFVCGGATYGRFIFTEQHALYVKRGIHNVKVAFCNFLSGGVSIES